MNWEFSPYLLLLAAHAAAMLLVVIVALRRNRGWPRFLGVLAGGAAIWTPLLVMVHTLGEPNPRPPDTVLRLLAVAQGEDEIYLFVDKQEGEPMPRMYNVPVVKHKYDDGLYHVQQTGYSGLLGVRVNVNDEGLFDVVFLDYEMPDWDKGNLQRGWREQRPRE